jgi:hypothetical protein
MASVESSSALSRQGNTNALATPQQAARSLLRGSVRRARQELRRECGGFSGKDALLLALRVLRRSCRSGEEARCLRYGKTHSGICAFSGSADRTREALLEQLQRLLGMPFADQGGSVRREGHHLEIVGKHRLQKFADRYGLRIAGHRSRGEKDQEWCSIAKHVVLPGASNDPALSRTAPEVMMPHPGKAGTPSAPSARFTGPQSFGEGGFFLGVRAAISLGRQQRLYFRPLPQGQGALRWVAVRRRSPAPKTLSSNLRTT